MQNLSSLPNLLWVIISWFMANITCLLIKSGVFPRFYRKKCTFNLFKHEWANTTCMNTIFYPYYHSLCKSTRLHHVALRYHACKIDPQGGTSWVVLNSLDRGQFTWSHLHRVLPSYELYLVVSNVNQIWNIVDIRVPMMGITGLFNHFLLAGKLPRPKDNSRVSEKLGAKLKQISWTFTLLFPYCFCDITYCNSTKYEKNAANSWL